MYTSIQAYVYWGDSCIKGKKTLQNAYPNTSCRSLLWQQWLTELPCTRILRVVWPEARCTPGCYAVTVALLTDGRQEAVPRYTDLQFFRYIYGISNCTAAHLHTWAGGTIASSFWRWGFHQILKTSLGYHHSFKSIKVYNFLMEIQNQISGDTFAKIFSFCDIVVFNILQIDTDYYSRKIKEQHFSSNKGSV